MIDEARLAEALARLDPGTRALLDLSLRRAIPDDQVAKVLGVDTASIPPRRARGIAQLADMMEIPGPAELAALLIAIPDLPEEAWGVPEVEPFTGGVSRARRARAFRRVAVAASPLVALGAVLAAMLVSSGSDHGGRSALTSATHRAGGAGGSGGAAPAAAAQAPDARHGLPPGAQLTLAHRPAAHRGARHAARHHRSRHHTAGAPDHAILARQPSVAPRTEPVAFHPAPVVVHESPTPRHAPEHKPHHQHSPTHPKQTPKPSPAPVQQPSVPVSAPSPPSKVTSPPVEVSAPVTGPAPSSGKPPKPPVPQPTNVGPPGGDGDNDADDGGRSDGGGCDSAPVRDSGPVHVGHHQGPPHSVPGHGGKGFTPPGLFRKRHGGHGHGHGHW